MPTVRPKPVGVTWVAARRLWKKSVGCKRRDDGRRVPTVFYLRADRRSAELEADALKARWRWFRMQGHDVWPDGEPDRLGIRTALGLEVGAPTPNFAQGRSSDSTATDQPPARHPASIRPGPPIKAVRGGLSLDFAARLYVAHQEERHRSGEISPRHLDDIKRRIRRIADFVGDSTPLDAIDSTRLRKFVKQVWFDKGFAISYAGNLVNQFRWLLDWASKDDRCGYVKPHRVFRPGVRSLFRARGASARRADRRG